MLKQVGGNLVTVILSGALLGGVAFSQQPAAPVKDAPPVSGLTPDHATLSVANLDVEQQWYTRVLGFKVLRKMDTNPDMINEQLSIPGYRIDMIKYKGSVRPPAGSTIYYNQGWVHVVFHVDDLAKALAQLQALNVKPQTVGRDDKGALTQILLRDPENNEIEIRQN